MYEQEKFEETVKQYEGLVEQSEDPETLASVWHNIGNSYLEAGQYAPSIEAYKNSLRNNPTDNDTKYNLAYAKQKLEEQQQQDKENQDKENQDKENQDKENQDKENQDKENQDKENQDKENQDKENQDQENQDQEKQDQEKQDQENQDEEKQQPQPLQISKEDAERMLSAIQQQEKDVKDKVDKKKAAAAKVKTEKDW